MSYDDLSLYSTFLFCTAVITQHDFLADTIVAPVCLCKLTNLLCYFLSSFPEGIDTTLRYFRVRRCWPRCGWIMTELLDWTPTTSARLWLRRTPIRTDTFLVRPISTGCLPLRGRIVFSSRLIVLVLPTFLHPVVVATALAFRLSWGRETGCNPTLAAASHFKLRLQSSINASRPASLTALKIATTSYVTKVCRTWKIHKRLPRSSVLTIVQDFTDLA